MDFETMKKIVDGAPLNAESYQDGYYFRENPEFQFHNGIHSQWNTTDNNGAYFKNRGFNPIKIDELRTELAKREPMELRAVDIPHGTIVLEK